MHASSLENMQKCYERYICGNYFRNNENITVLDIGGANVNGSYSDIFSPAKFNYIAADIAAGEGVDLVLEDPYKLPFDDGSVDIIISGQAFEHVEYFWLLFEEMTRVVKVDGWILLIAPSAGPIHRYPVDCYRFYPDAYFALAKYAGLHVVNVFHDKRGPWQDLVGVFSKSIGEDKELSFEWQPPIEAEVNRYLIQRMPVSTQVEPQSEEVELTKGERSYLEVLKALHDEIHPSLYVEIGVRRGSSLALARGRTIAIDPEPDIDPDEYGNVELFRVPSDYFFDRHWPLESDRSPVELAFIDGMHLFEFVLRDFMNLEARSSRETVVIVDDVFPNHIAQATRERATQVWTGDVWKFLVCLRECRPDLSLTMLDTHPTGLLVIRGLKKNKRALWDQYNPIVRKYIDLELEGYQDLILNRVEALSLSGQGYEALLASVRKKR